MATTTGLGTAAAATGGKKALEGVVADLYGAAKGGIKSKIRRWQTDRKISTLYRKIANVRNVKTIWQIDREVDLLEFYYPSSVNTEKGRARINTPEELEQGHNILLEGTVGQGKSIFLRFLCSQELCIGRRIPVFAELRRLRARSSLLEFLLERLRVLGFNVDPELFEFLAIQGKLVLFLDGFDEVPKGLQPNLVTQIETLAERYENLRIIITSRPGSVIASSPFLRILRLAELPPEEIRYVIRKLTGGAAIGEQLIASLEHDSAGVSDVLTTPLMVTLLVITYRAHLAIPDRLSEFFKQLFEILLARHDKSKPGFVREKKCGLNDVDISDVFNLLCFLTRKTEEREFSESKMLELAEQAIRELALECDDADYLDDIREVTCLILREGGCYRFIHNSIQEFHSAVYIRTLRDEAQSQRFYSQMLDGHWKDWHGELRFLQDIDPYRFRRSFLIPDLEKLLTALTKRVPKTWNRTPMTVANRLAEMLFSQCGMAPLQNHSPVMLRFKSGRRMSWWLLNREDQPSFDPVVPAYFDTVRGLSAAQRKKLLAHPRAVVKKQDHGVKELVVVPSSFAIESRPANSPFDRAVHALISTAVTELTNARESVAAVQSRKRLLDL